jgi:hypothetical protein
MNNNNIERFDICQVSKIPDGVMEGFIHSPDYPKYYGNSRNCYLNLNLPNENFRLFVYLISMNVESKGWFSRVPKDYLYIENIEKSFFGEYKPQIVLAENRLTKFRFITDFVTSTSLNDPKGVLLYFKSKIISFEFNIRRKKIVFFFKLLNYLKS